MKKYEVFTATFSKIVNALDKDSAKTVFEEMFKDAEILEIREYTYLWKTENA